MSEELKPSTEGQPENAAATAPEPPTGFREYVKWREAGGLPEKEPETQPAAAEPTPQAKTEPQSGAEQTPAGEEDEDEEPSKPGRGSSRQRRIDRLTRENELLKQQLAGAPKPAAPEPPKAPEPPGKPKLHDYPTLEAYQEALTDWKLDQRESQRKAEAQQAEAQAAEQKIQAAWSKSEDTARTSHTDYDEVIQSVQAPEGPGVMAARQAMLEDEAGAEILYHLATHPEELSRIAAMSPVSAVREIGKLSATLVPPTPAGNPKPKVSGAPKPPAPLSRPTAGNHKRDILDEDFAKNDFRSWEKERVRQLKG